MRVLDNIAQWLFFNCLAEKREDITCCPGNTKLRYAPQSPVKPLKRFEHLQNHGVKNALWWYADYPENVVGDARPASEEKGRVMLNIYSHSVARAIKAVKEDTEVWAGFYVTMEIMQDLYYNRMRRKNEANRIKIK